MRHLARVLVAVTSLLTALSITTLVPNGGASTAWASGGGNAITDTGFVERMLFEAPLSEFSDAARRRVGPDGVAGDPWFDWSTDFCSAPLVGNSGRTFNFTEPCRRHDFGYRNTKLLDRHYGAGRYWTAGRRKQIDQQFLNDMLAHCASRRFIDRPTCISWAYTFYGAVRIAGGP